VGWTITSIAFAPVGVSAQSHEQGVAAGTAANTVIRGLVNQPSATAVVPGYTNSPPETAYAGRQSLGADANARLAACGATPNDPVCQALRGAVSSANTPRPAVLASDPAVAAASRIARNPSLTLGSLAAYYSGCTTAEVSSAAGTSTQQCRVYSGIGAYTTLRDLNVEVELVPSCNAGDWFVHGEAFRNASDYMVAEAQCSIRTDQKQRFRFYAAGSHGGCIGWQEVEKSTGPVFVTDLAPHWSGGCRTPFKVVMATGSGCNAGSCRYRFEFGTPQYSCSSGSVLGSTLSGLWGGSELQPGPADRCFTLSDTDSEGACAAADMRVDDGSTIRCATASGAATLTGASGWTIPLSFTQPTMNASETDVWVDRSAALQPGGRCNVLTADRCVDGPATRVIGGREVTRDCWSFERTLNCSGAAAQDDCAPLAAQGCTLVSSQCSRTEPVTGACELTQKSYACPTPAQTVTTASNCPADVFCLGTSCFNTSQVGDTDFARSMSMLEAARQAGVYLDTNLMQVFQGEDNRCRDKLLKNCCYANGAGRGMSNQTVFAVGTRLVFDLLMNSSNRDFVAQGMKALLGSAGFSGTYSTYGFTVAVNGVALPSGSTVLYASSTTAGEGVVLAFNPWSLAITAVIYVALTMSECNEGEARLALKEGAGLCHQVGRYCSSCIMVLGSCVSCIEHTTSKCCFNSMLARIVNQQGRAQVGKGWGGPDSPDCSGFTIAQLQSLDFAAMDLSEFYASLVPVGPDLGALQTGNASRVPGCYYGQGKCQ
jgi:conjugal transfer mating pair stabilization protein TraN